MSGILAGKRVMVPETRELEVLAKMLERHGAAVLRCPLVAIIDAPDPAPVEAWLRRFIATPPDDLILLTGEGLSRLLGVAGRAGIEAEFRAALAGVRRIVGVRVGGHVGVLDREQGELHVVDQEKRDVAGVGVDVQPQLVERLPLHLERVVGEGEAARELDLGRVHEHVRQVRVQAHGDRLRAKLEQLDAPGVRRVAALDVD